MLKINCVLINGKLVGKTVSDRWNLASIGYNNGHDPIQDKPISQAAARRLANALDCQIVLHKANQSITPKPNRIERESLGRKLIKLFSLAA